MHYAGAMISYRLRQPALSSLSDAMLAPGLVAALDGGSPASVLDERRCS
jgi:hypothetical protein